MVKHSCKRVKIVIQNVTLGFDEEAIITGDICHMSHDRSLGDFTTK